MLKKHIAILLILATVIVLNTISLYKNIVMYSYQLNKYSILMPILGFHMIAFIISFIHWFLDTWTTKNEKLRKRTFNQAKTHHYYPHLVVQKTFFARNDDAIYGALVFGMLYRFMGSLNSKILMYSAMLSVMISLEIHRYAHMKKKNVPLIIRWLQKTGIILNQESHKQHHNGKFRQSYDLMSANMNALVDWIGIYPKLEWLVTKLTEIHPRTYLKDMAQKKELQEYYHNHRIK